MNKTKQGQIKGKHNPFCDEFCFHTHYGDIKATNGAFEYYTTHNLSKNDIVDNDVYIAFDTNVLLDLYSISFSEREMFIRFIQKNAKRIIIPAQVEEEYMRHRRTHIQKFQRTLKDIPAQADTAVNTFKRCFDTVITSLKQLSNRKIVSKDMENVETNIADLKAFVETGKFGEDFIKGVEDKYTPLKENLKKGVEKSLKKAVYEYDDPVLTALSQATMLTPIPQNEKDFLNHHYQLLLGEFNAHKQNLQEKDFYTFPGSGDRKKIKDGMDPFGDFYIYHELLDFIKQTKKDIVFLTCDVEKSDWISDSKKPFPHYLVDTYHNTQQMIYIFNADDVIPLTFKSVVDDDSADDEEDAVASNLATNSNNTKKENEQDSFTTIEKSGKYFEDVSEEVFLEELYFKLKWQAVYGNGYLSDRHFIFYDLGRKKYNWHSSKKVLLELEKKKMIAVEDVIVDGNKFKSIMLTDLYFDTHPSAVRLKQIS